MNNENVDPAFIVFISALTVSIWQLGPEGASSFLTQLETLAEEHEGPVAAKMTDSDKAKLIALLGMLREKVFS